MWFSLSFFFPISTYTHTLPRHGRTQIAQFILEEALLRGDGHKVNLVCTQPRRVAAVSLAERVAQELGDSGAGVRDGLVGYQIRMEAKTTAATRLTFCTTGILLRKLQTDPLLEQYTHIILDEGESVELMALDGCGILLPLPRKTQLNASYNRSHPPHQYTSGRPLATSCSSSCVTSCPSGPTCASS